MTAIRKGARVEIWKGDQKRTVRRRWYLRTVAANNRVDGTGQGYTRRRSAIIAGTKAARGRPVFAQDKAGNWQLERPSDVPGPAPDDVPDGPEPPIG